MSTPRSRCLPLFALGFACAALLGSMSPVQARDTAPAPTLARAALDTVDKVWSGAQDVASYSLGLIGVNYRFGGNTPASGLDCSGLVRYVFQEVTGVTLPRTAKELSTLGRKITLDELKVGDLVFFNTRRFQYSHVGIYLGDNQFIHAPSRGGEVGIARLSASYWQRSFDGARRLVGVIPALVPSLVSTAEASGPVPSALTAAMPAMTTLTMEAADAISVREPSVILDLIDPAPGESSSGSPATRP